MGIFDRVKALLFETKPSQSSESTNSVAKASRNDTAIPQVADTDMNSDRQCGLIKRVGLSPTLNSRTASLLFITDSEPQAHAPGMSVTISFDAGTGKATLGRNPVDDPSTIYTRLAVRKPGEIGNVPKLDYYPTYSGLTPEQRWIYLNWLGDISKEIEVGYVFIYYYGLERHLVIGDYDAACDEIALLRKHHSNSSFQSYSRSAILHACLLRNRLDRLEQIYKNDPPIEYENADLLIAFKSNSDLSPESLFRVSPRIRGINRKYIKSHPEQYLQAIQDVLILKYEQPLFPFASRYKIDDLPKKQEIVFANISFPGELRAPEFMNFYDYAPFVTELSSIFGEAHLVTKQILAEERKQGKLPTVPSKVPIVETPAVATPREPSLSAPTTTSEPFLLFKYSFREIGRLTPVCPHCNTQLDKFPGRKKKCPTCSEFIYVRTRPSDRQKVLVTGAEASELEEQYDAISGIDTRGVEYRFTHEDAALFISKKKALQAASVSEVQNWQVCVAILEEDSVSHRKNNDWGLFRNARLDIAMLLQKGGSPDKALPYYFQTCYVDINGGSNCGGLSDFCKPFDPSCAMVATGVYELILRALRHAENTDAQLKETFMAVTAALHQECRMPISPTTAYDRFAKQLKKQEEIA